MKDQIKLLGTARALRLRPGDTIVITLPGHISEEAAGKITEALKGKFPGHEVIIFGDGAKLGVLAKADK